MKRIFLIGWTIVPFSTTVRIHKKISQKEKKNNNKKQKSWCLLKMQCLSGEPFTFCDMTFNLSMSQPIILFKSQTFIISQTPNRHHYDRNGIFLDIINSGFGFSLTYSHHTAHTSWIAHYLHAHTMLKLPVHNTHAQIKLDHILYISVLGRQCEIY